jgi:hypothetical protein
MMPGTITRRLVVVSSWESGSCFTSELLVSHPGAYYQPDPLKQFGGIRIRDPTEEKADIVYKVVSGLLNCNNSALKGTFQLLRVRFCLHQIRLVYTVQKNHQIVVIRKKFVLIWSRISLKLET